MKNIYGVLGKEFIDVHYIVPLHEISKKYQVNPIEKLRPVCPNCHVIIHRRNPVYSIEEIKQDYSFGDY